MEYILAALIGLLMGGLPTGRAVGFIANDPILAQGTGNPGPLLWLKQGRFGTALMAFALEAGKVVAAMQLAWLVSYEYNPLLLAGVVAVVSHGYSVFSKFRPCRSFSPYIGFALGATIWAGVWLAVLWVFVFGLMLRQYRALAAVIAFMPLVLFLLKGHQASFAAIAVCCFALWHYRRGLWQMFRRQDLAWPREALMKTLKERRL